MAFYSIKQIMQQTSATKAQLSERKLTVDSEQNHVAVILQSLSTRFFLA